MSKGGKNTWKTALIFETKLFSSFLFSPLNFFTLMRSLPSSPNTVSVLIGSQSLHSPFGARRFSLSLLFFPRPTEAAVSAAAVVVCVYELSLSLCMLSRRTHTHTFPRGPKRDTSKERREREKRGEIKRRNCKRKERE